MTRTELVAKQKITDERTRVVMNYHLNQTRERIRELTTGSPRKVRSINWLGSAWKWVAGSPDATDWDNILNTKNELIDNNNHQCKINEELFDISKEIIHKLNTAITRLNNEVNKTETEDYRQEILNRVLILKEEINEIVRACQMAKKGIVNSNLLNSEEVNRILNELETLPYQNVVEAIEYAEPSVYTNGTLMLYILSIPRVNPEPYHLITARASVKNGTQVVLKHTRLLIDHKETYGLIGSCLQIGNTTVCESKVLERLNEDSCLPRLLKGGRAACDYEMNNAEVVELIGENTVFVTNFEGDIINKNSSTHLVGTFLIQLRNNDTVRIKGKTFGNTMVNSPQALPPVLSNVTNRGMKEDLKYVQDLGRGHAVSDKRASD